jgi:hypothetical protein
MTEEPFLASIHREVARQRFDSLEPGANVRAVDEAKAAQVAMLPYQAEGM